MSKTPIITFDIFDLCSEFGMNRPTSRARPTEPYICVINKKIRKGGMTGMPIIVIISAMIRNGIIIIAIKPRKKLFQNPL